MTSPFSPFDTIWIARNAVVGWFGITTNLAQVAVVVTPTVTATMIATRKGAVSLTVHPTITATMKASFKDTLSLTVTPTISASANVIRAIYGARTTVDIPNPYVGPMALRNRTRMPYYSRAQTGPTPDSVGSGNNSSAGSLTWTDNATAGATALAFIVTSGINSISSITYGGTSMTSVGSVPLNNVTSNGTLYLYKLAGVLGGSQTVSVTLGAAGNATGNTVSYTSVTTVGLPSTTFSTGTSLSQALTDSANQVIVQAFASTATGWSANGGGTNRYISGAFAPALAIQDAISNATFTATTVSDPWAGIGVVLS